MRNKTDSFQYYFEFANSIHCYRYPDLIDRNLPPGAQGCNRRTWDFKSYNVTDENSPRLEKRDLICDKFTPRIFIRLGCVPYIPICTHKEVLARKPPDQPGDDYRRTTQKKLLKGNC